MIVESFGIDPARAIAASLLSDEELQEAWEKGGSMTLEDAVSFAHHLADAGVDKESPR